MNENVCLPKNHLLIIFLTLIGLTSWYIHNENEKKNKNSNYINCDNDNLLNNLKQIIHDLKVELKNKEKKNKIRENEIKENEIRENKKISFLKNRDKQVIYNDFAPPERRQPKESYPYNYVKHQLNVPTRGLPDNYHLIGVLLRNNTESAFNLFGRQTFPGSNQWEYYVQGNLSDTSVKIPLEIKGDKELLDGENVSIPGSDSSKGDFKLKLYEYDTPRYNPYF